MQNNVEIQKVIKTARKILGITQKELAEKAGVSISVITRLEQGLHDSKLKGIDKVIAACGINYKLPVNPKHNIDANTIGFYICPDYKDGEDTTARLMRVNGGMHELYDNVADEAFALILKVLDKEYWFYYVLSEAKNTIQIINAAKKRITRMIKKYRKNVPSTEKFNIFFFSED